MKPRDITRRPLGTDGISEVVGFVIILAIVMAGLSLYLTYAVPIQGREEEITVMDNVRAWFVDYKTGVDQLWMNSPVVPNDNRSGDSFEYDPFEYDPLESTPPIDWGRALYSITTGQVTLRRVISPGTTRETGFIPRYMPVLAPIPASAEVSVRTGDNLTITGWRNVADRPVISRTFNAPALVYSSHNNYWLQQEYSYQLGAVFLRQWDLLGDKPMKMTVVQTPPLSIYPPEGEADGQTTVGMVVVNLNATAGGFGVTSPVRIETNLSTNPLALEPSDNPMWTNFSRVTLRFEGASNESAEAWYKVFKGAADRNKLNSSYYNATPPTASSACVATIDIISIRDPGTGPNTRDVQFEVLVADYCMRMENVPTMIE